MKIMTSYMWGFIICLLGESLLKNLGVIAAIFFIGAWITDVISLSKEKEKQKNAKPNKCLR